MTSVMFTHHTYRRGIPDQHIYEPPRRRGIYVCSALFAVSALSGFFDRRRASKGSNLEGAEEAETTREPVLDISASRRLCGEIDSITCRKRRRQVQSPA